VGGIIFHTAENPEQYFYMSFCCLISTAYVLTLKDSAHFIGVSTPSP